MRRHLNSAPCRRLRRPPSQRPSGGPQRPERCLPGSLRPAGERPDRPLRPSGRRRQTGARPRPPVAASAARRRPSSRDRQTRHRLPGRRRGDGNRGLAGHRFRAPRRSSQRHSPDRISASGRHRARLWVLAGRPLGRQRGAASRARTGPGNRRASNTRQGCIIDAHLARREKRQAAGASAAKGRERI